MHLYFFRHGIAHTLQDGIADPDRSLTAIGIERTRQSARSLRSLGVEIDFLYTSPLVRARQTADILGAALGVAVQVRQELSPGFGIPQVERLTHDLGAACAVMFVGHEPDFSNAIQQLTGGSVIIKKGGLARIDVIDYQPLRGQLAWMIAPKVFKRLG